MFDLKDSEGILWIEYVKVADGFFGEFFYDGVEEEKQQYNHIRFKVEYIEALAEKLRNKDVDFSTELLLGKETNKQCFIMLLMM